MHHQTDERSGRSEKWHKFSGNLEYAWQLVKNISGMRTAEVLKESTEEHKVLRPMKRATTHESCTVTEKGPSHGKNWSYRASWRGGHVPKFAMRQQRKDVSPKHKESSTRTEILFLWCFSAPYWERILPHSRKGRPVHELSSLSSRREKPSREMENETIRILLERQKEKILADFRAEIQKHEFQADSDRRSIQELNGIIESQRRQNDHTLAGDEQLRRY